MGKKEVNCEVCKGNGEMRRLPKGFVMFPHLHRKKHLAETSPVSTLTSIRRIDKEPHSQGPFVKPPPFKLDFVDTCTQAKK